MKITTETIREFGPCYNPNKWIEDGRKYDLTDILRMGDVPINDFSLPVLRFWFGVIVAETMKADIWPGFDNDSGLLKSILETLEREYKLLKEK